MIVGIKDATADLSRPPCLRALCGADLLQYSGDDATAAAHRAMGGAGCISVTANVVPKLCAALHRAGDVGDLEAFARLRDQLDPLKAALAELGLCADTVRLPLLCASSATLDRLRAVLPSDAAAKPRLGQVPRFALAS